MSAVAAIELHDLCVELGRVRAVDGVCLSVAAGEWVALIGPNGAGKTTVLRAIAGLVRHRGTVRLAGADAESMHRRARARHLAVVPQDPSTPPWMTVGEYVLLGRTPHMGMFEQESRRDHEAAAEALRRLDLGGLAHRRLGTLSGGERQRAVVARALAQEAATILLDEPTSALDIGHQQQALEMLDALRASSGLTLVAAMHDLTLAAQYADRMVLLDGGRVVAQGRPVEVLTEELLGRHYDADVHVLEVDGRLAVVPVRALAGRTG